MKNVEFADLWRWEGTIGRGPYALIGILGFALKHNLDRLVATLVFHRRWGLFNYWVSPAKAVHITELSRKDAQMLATMLALALPFIWAGVVLTLRRLRAAGLPTPLVILFFAPVLNLAFFAILSVLPSRPEEDRTGAAGREIQATFLDRLIPEGQLGSAALAVFATVILGALAAAWGTEVLLRYGWGLFVGLPFCLGLASVLIYGYHRERPLGSCLLVAMISLVLLGGVLLALAFEGGVCLAMAAPIALTITLMGALIGYCVQRRSWHRPAAPRTLSVVFLFAPLVMSVEAAVPPPPRSSRSPQQSS